MKRSQAVQLALGLACALAYGREAIAHPFILPAPRVIHEADGHFPLRGARICFASKPSTEDLFAAHELAAKFSRAAHLLFPVQEAACNGKAILFKRTGAGADVPQPGETAGKNSREAYKDLDFGIRCSGGRPDPLPAFSTRCKRWGKW